MVSGFRVVVRGWFDSREVSLLLLLLGVLLLLLLFPFPKISAAINTFTHSLTNDKYFLIASRSLEFALISTPFLCISPVIC